MNQDDSGIEVPAAPLTYPWPDPPAPGTLQEVAPGVRWLRMPLPFALDHINLWVLDDDDGWTIVDTGLGATPVREAWRGLLEGELAGRPVKRVIVTHYHPDHMGQAGWLCRKFGVPLWMSRTDFLMGRMLYLDRWESVPEEAVTFYRQGGLAPELIEAWRGRQTGGFRSVVAQLPLGYTRMIDGQGFLINGRTWVPMVGRGHTPEHMCLHCPELGVLISGDQVLPRISSNVSVYPTEPEADPLADWIESCARLKRLLPDATLVLPSHNEPFYGLHARLQALIDGHEDKLEQVRQACATPQRATDVFGAIFKRPVKPDQTMLALGESLAHLRCLAGRGRVRQSQDGDGVLRFQMI